MLPCLEAISNIEPEAVPSGFRDAAMKDSVLFHREQAAMLSDGVTVGHAGDVIRHRAGMFGFGGSQELRRQ